MTECISKITSLTHAAGQPYRKGLTYEDINGNIKQSFPPKGTHRANIHVIKDFQKDLEETLTSLWGRLDTTLIAHPVDVQRDGDILAERTSECMQTENTKSDIVMIDVDNVNGEDIIPVGDTLAEQLNNFMLEHFSFEMLQAKKVIKMSSSYYIKGSFKFHCYFKLKHPILHGAWANFILNGAFAHADKSLFNNSSQILFSAKPMGKDWITKLKHNEPAIFTYEGDELFVDTRSYTPAPTKSRSTGVNVARLPNLKLKPLNSAIVSKIDDLDMGKGSRLKLFQAYLKLVALGYDVESWNELPQIEAQLFARKELDKHDDKLHYILSQPSYARQWVRNGCVDKFGNEEDIRYLPNHVNAQINFKTLKKNNPTLESDLKALPIVLNWCKAPTGTGKTLGLSEFRKRKGAALITAPTLALVSANAKDFGRGTLAVNGDSEAVASTFKGNVSTTMQSLHKLTYAARAGSFKVVVIDEAAQCLTALLGIANTEIKAKIIDTLLCLFRHADYVVLCDADLTETVISNYGLILKDVELTHELMNVAKKQDLAVRFAEGARPNSPAEPRNAYMYESTNEVIKELSTSLTGGKRCLVIVNSKLLLQKLKRTLGTGKGHYYFCADNYGEPTTDDFKDNPKVFVAARKPKLLACTQILKSGVSFIDEFDDVFVIDYSMNSTDRLIIQMISRERAWRNAHIYVNNIDVAKTKAVNFATNYDVAFTASCNDTRDQLRIRA